MGNKKISSEWIIFGIILAIICFSFLGFIIIEYQSKSMLEKDASFYGVITFIPLLGYVFAFSVINKLTFSKGVKVYKDENPVSYWILTLFWGGLFFLSILYVIFQG